MTGSLKKVAESLTVADLDNNLSTHINEANRIDDDFARAFEAPTNAL